MRVYTLLDGAILMLQMHNMCDADYVLDPSKGEGVFYDQVGSVANDIMADHRKAAVWTKNQLKISDSVDFFCACKLLCEIESIF